MQRPQNLRLLAGGFFLVVLSVFVGFLGGRQSINAGSMPLLTHTVDGAVATSTDFAPFWKAWQILEEKHAGESPSDQDKVWGAIQGLAASFGDPYTTFFPPEEATAFEEDIEGNFSGIGVEIGLREGILTVISPLKGTPADRAGIKSGDLIVKIGDLATSDLSVEKAIKMIRGPEGTPVVLTIFREGIEKPFEVSVTRAKIQVPTLETLTTKEGVFVIRLYSFTATSPDLFRQALRQFMLSGKDKMILDLRGNPGGYLEAAVDMASWFLPAGKVVVREDFGSEAEEVVYRSKGYDIFNDRLKMIVLVDEGSASASEILAAALHDHGVAQLLGTKTFGKGSVQELIQLTPETSLKVTVARWLTPQGVSISESGILPDVAVMAATSSATTTITKVPAVDLQMKKAVELLVSGM